MGVLFNRGGTGLTPQGDPMTENELAMLLSSMQTSGGLSNMMKGLFARRAMKNRSGARAAKTKSGIAGALPTGQPSATMIRPQGGPGMGGNRAPGGGFSLGLGQGGGNEMAQLMAMMTQGGAGAGSPRGAATPAPFPQEGAGDGSALTRPRVPPIQPSRGSLPASPGPPGVMGGNVSPSSTKSLVTGAGKGLDKSSPASASFGDRVKQFYAVTPGKVKAIQDMMLSQDPMLREVAKGWLTALSSGPKPEDQYLMFSTGAALDIYNNKWIMPPKGEKTDVEQLKPGLNMVIVTHPDSSQSREIIDVPEGGDYQLVKGVETDPKTGIERNRWITVDKNTSLGREVIVNGKTLGAGSNVAITGEFPGSTVGKWADKAFETELALTRMEHIRQYLPDIMRVQTFQGKALFKLQDTMAGLGLKQGENYYKSVKGMAAAWDVTNRYIKLITGAQMSEREATRLMKAIPNPDDNPQEYLAKFEMALEMAQLTYDHWNEIYQRYLREDMGEEEAALAAQADIADEVDMYITEIETYSPWST